MTHKAPIQHCDFKRLFHELTGNPDPFPWQEELFRRFMTNSVERSLDIPTGLGKTAVMAIWLLARAEGATIPRRLVYVVDRRAVVDQASEVANKRATRWQRAFNAPTPGVYAKTLGPINFALLDGYRHEFSSLEVAARDAEFPPP